MITKERLISGTGNINRAIAQALALCSQNPSLRDEEWGHVREDMSRFVWQVASLHDGEAFSLDFGPVSIFGESFPEEDEYGTYSGYRVGVRGFGRVVYV